MRRWLERAASVTAALILFWLAVTERLPAPRAPAAHAAELGPEELARRTLEAAPDTVRHSFRELPDPVSRDWLAALAASGRSSRWSMVPSPPIAVASESARDPAGGVHIRLASAGRASPVLADRIGPLDTIELDGPVTSVRHAGFPAAVSATVPDQRAVSGEPLLPRLRRALVLARAGWEAKFVIAALEERGWEVDVRLAIAPGAAVGQGAWSRPDTARHSLTIVLDSTAASFVPRLLAFVRAGGGLVVAGEATRLASLAPVLPATAGTAVLPRPAPSRTDSLGERGVRFPLQALRPDAIVLERRGDEPVIAARRERRGRVIQVADAESWRRRLAPAEGSVERHREGWARIASAAAFAPAPAAAAPIPASETDPAPWAATIGTLGAPERGGRSAPELAFDPTPLFFLALMFALLGAWTSRRVRGAP